MPRLEALDEWGRARADLDRLTTSRDFRAAADELHTRWPRHPPDFFRFTSQTRRYRLRRAFADGAGWAARLLMSVDIIAHFSLHAEHLDLDPSAAAPHLILDPANRDRWKKAIVANFRGPHRWRLALGDGGRVHAHILADLSDGPPNIPRGGELAKPCESYLEAAVAYQLRPPLEYTPEHLAIWLEHRATGRRSPRLSGVVNIPSAAMLGQRSDLREYFPIQPTIPAATAPQLSLDSSDDRAPAPPDAAPPLDEPQLPAPASSTAPSSTSRASTSRPSRLFGNLVDCLVATTPPAPLKGVCRLQSYPVRRTQHRRPPRARGPPHEALAALQPLDLS